jgi:folate-binding protein YgfZ
VSDEQLTRLARLRGEGGLYPIDDVVRFGITGADRVRYLNGQVSNDVRKLISGTAMQACILSAKGKLDGVVWLWAEPEQIVIEADASLAETLAMRLERYIVADDVQCALLPTPTASHVFGEAALKLDGLHISRLGVPGVDISTPIEDCLEAWPEEIERLRIEQCVPKWGAELGLDTLPAEAGLDRTAVDFHKGCYIGQEVVSRIRSVGHANRSLRIFDLLSGKPPAVGDEFFSGGDTARSAAKVTSIQFTLSTAVGLCYIRRGTPEGAVLATAAGDSQIQLRQPENA